jgi:hypothetical protein
MVEHAPVDVSFGNAGEAEKLPKASLNRRQGSFLKFGLCTIRIEFFRLAAAISPGTASGNDGGVVVGMEKRFQTRSQYRHGQQHDVAPVHTCHRAKIESPTSSSRRREGATRHAHVDVTFIPTAHSLLPRVWRRSETLHCYEGPRRIGTMKVLQKHSLWAESLATFIPLDVCKSRRVSQSEGCTGESSLLLRLEVAFRFTGISDGDKTDTGRRRYSVRKTSSTSYGIVPRNRGSLSPAREQFQSR